MFIGIDFNKENEDYALYVREFRRARGIDVSNPKYQQPNESNVKFKNRITRYYAVNQILEEATKGIKAIFHRSSTISKEMEKVRGKGLKTLATVFNHFLPTFSISFEIVVMQ